MEPADVLIDDPNDVEKKFEQEVTEQTGWPEVCDGLPVVANGTVKPAEGPGLGISLKPGVLQRADASVTESR